MNLKIIDVDDQLLEGRFCLHPTSRAVPSIWQVSQIFAKRMTLMTISWISLMYSGRFLPLLTSTHGVFQNLIIILCFKVSHESFSSLL